MNDGRGLTRIILAASAGNALEFYDFTIFGYFVPQISDAFFPAHTQTTSLLYTWGTYATAFLARPLGAVVLGSYADRVGRKAAMTLAIVLMTLGTAMMAAMPGYETIGLVAPAGVLLARLLQGFSTGGEFGGATAFMLEHGRGRRGFMASFQFSSQVASMLAGAGAGWLTSVAIGPQALHDWGFRLPFLGGLLIGPVGLYLRRHVDETPVFEQSSHTSRPAVTMLLHHPVRASIAACTLAAGTAATYINQYLPTYAQTELHMSPRDSYAVTLLGSLIALVVTPAAAILSDRIGRLVPAVVGVTVLMGMAYPSFAAIVAFPSFTVVMLAAALIATLRSFYTAALPALYGELFPPAVRGVGMSVTYSLGVLAFGSITPVVNTWAVKMTGLKSFPGIWLAAASAISLVSLIVIWRKYELERDD